MVPVSVLHIRQANRVDRHPPKVSMQGRATDGVRPVPLGNDARIPDRARVTARHHGFGSHPEPHVDTP